MNYFLLFLIIQYSRILLQLARLGLLLPFTSGMQLTWRHYQLCKASIPRAFAMLISAQVAGFF